MKRLALIAALALAFPAGASAEPSIGLGGEVEPPCSYCQPLSGTISGGADAVAFRAASSPYSLSYSWALQEPCPWRFTPEAASCPRRITSGPFEMGWAPGWSEPETLTLYVWAERNGERCSRSQLVTLPATVAVACRGLATTAKHHHHRILPFI
jgi:hypothetical protein